MPRSAKTSFDYTAIVPDYLEGATIWGTDGGNRYSGTASKTVFVGAGGNDYFTGMEGVTNTAVYAYSVENYTLKYSSNGTLYVVALKGNEGTDSLKNVSQLIFDGKTYKIEPGAEARTAPTLTLLTAEPTSTTPTDTTTTATPIVPDYLESATIWGDDGGNRYSGTATKTVFVGGGGNDYFTGMAGIANTAVYAYSVENYKLKYSSSGTLYVAALIGNEGTDSLKNVSQLIFAGKTYKIEPGAQPGTVPTLTLVTPEPSTTTPTTDTTTAPTDTTTAPTDTTTAPTDTTDQTTAPADTTTTPTDTTTAPTDTTTAPTDTTTAPTDTTTAPTDSQPSPTTPAPSPSPAPVTSAPGDIVGFSLQNTTGAAEGSGYVTFGQVFAKGEVMPGTSLIVKIGGQNVAVQMDVKTTNPDGSVAHAILTLKAPEMVAGATMSGVLAKGGTSPAGATINASDIIAKGYDLKVEVKLHNADGSITTKVVDGAQVLQQAITNGTVETWMKGSQASEFRVETEIAPNLSVKLDIRMDANGETHTDVVFARDDAYTTDVGTLNYDVKISQGGQTLFNDTGINQHAYSTWHQAVSSPGSVNPHVVYDMQYLVNTGAMPAYDLSSGVNASVIAGQADALAASDTGPMGSALIKQYMPGTGQSQLGPELLWTAQYLNDQSATAYKTMMANADAAGSVPWHFMDTNGDAIRVDLHPTLRLSNGSSSSTDKLPVDPATVDRGGWTPDSAHAPSLTYVPYLLTGSRYYLDELQAKAAWTIAVMNPSYRGYDDGLFTDSMQVRSLAWSLRDIANASYVSPDGEAMKAYFADILDNNLDRILNEYVNGAKGDAQGDLEGWIKGTAGDGTVVKPWQQDYLATVFGMMAERGSDKAADILGWMDNFLSGRFLNEANGFNPLNGPAYNLYVIDPSTGKPYQTWAEAYQASFPDAAPPTELAGNPDWAAGYAARAKAALASVISTNQSPDAIEAYGYLQSLTTKMTADYLNSPTFDIAPELAEGKYLTANEITVHTGTTTVTLTAGDGEAMLIGNIGNDTIIGGSGIGMLFGMDGNDTVKAGSGNSYLYGGDGSDRLVDGAGANYFKGGTGADVYAFLTASAGRDVISDFTKGTDHLEIKSDLNGSGILTTSDVIARATEENGNAVLHLGGSHDIVLQGVALHQLTTDIFSIV